MSARRRPEHSIVHGPHWVVAPNHERLWTRAREPVGLWTAVTHA